MEKEIKGVIIRTTDYREKDRLLTVFTPCGAITVTAKGVRSATAKLRSSTSLLTYGDFSVQDGRSKVLSGVEVCESFFPCWNDPKKYAVAMFCLELTEKCFSREDDTKSEFVTLLKVLTEISYGTTDVAYVALWYAYFCAERMGVEYDNVTKIDPDAATLLSTVAADGRMQGVVGASENDFFNAIRLLSACFYDFYGIKIFTLLPMEKLYRKS